MRKRPLSVMDIECFKDYFLVGWRDHLTGRETLFEFYPGHPLDVQGLLAKCALWTAVTFNGWKYDEPMLAAALTGYDNAQLKYISDCIIQQNLMPWEVRNQFKTVRIPDFDQIDLFNIPPHGDDKFVSLKQYEAKMHSRTIADLPFEHHEAIDTPERRHIVRTYWSNDAISTGELVDCFKDQIEQREALSERYGVDMRSKSDAQIAEAVFKARLGFTPEPGYVPIGTQYLYQAPGFVYFQTPELQELLHFIQAVPFEIGASGAALLPDALKAKQVQLAGNAFTVRMGGLHSTETSCYHLAGNGVVIRDVDVASYYPRTIDVVGMFPPQLGPAFLEIYRQLIADRIAAKEAGRKKESDTGKIMVNGTFGKLGNAYSILYAPHLLLQVTITGQLALLMLIEAMHLNDIRVISANTDGLVLKCRDDQVTTREAICKWWESVTGYTLEGNDYAAIFSRDVNSYIAFSPDGKVKKKGEFADPVPVASSWPAPECQISVAALVAYLKDGVPIEHTVSTCQDVRQFVSTRKVSGGAFFEGQKLGRVARWYYCRNGGAIKNGKGHQVANAEGVRPMMTLTDTVPLDLDRDYYVIRAKRMLLTLGVTFVNPY